MTDQQQIQNLQWKFEHLQHQLALLTARVDELEKTIQENQSK
jgi:hypothetical protein